MRCGKARSETTANRCWPNGSGGRCRARIALGDMVLVEAGEMIPGDGEMIEGVASVDESAITGESRR
jgi:K+-transporting ATPase ATPase B chain